MYIREILTSLGCDYLIHYDIFHSLRISISYCNYTGDETSYINYVSE